MTGSCFCFKMVVKRALRGVRKVATGVMRHKKKIAAGAALAAGAHKAYKAGKSVAQFYNKLGGGASKGLAKGVMGIAKLA